MAELECSTKTYFGIHEKWNLNNGFVVDISLEKESCVLFIRDRFGNDYAEIVSKFFNAQNLNHEFAGSIDSMSIELSKCEKEKALGLIEKAW